MGITMSPQEYATAFRLLAASAWHPENIQQVVEERILPRLPKQATLLDVGAGSGKVAERLAPHFSSLTLLEPNQNQIAGFKLEKAKILLKPLEHYHSPERYELVVCSHVLYVMAAARDPTYELCRDFSETMLFGEQLLTTMQHKQLPHEVLPTMSGFVARTFEEMYTLCRFFVLEGCFTAEQLAALSEDEVRALDARIRVHAERCRGDDGVYRLEQDEDLILLPSSYPSAGPSAIAFPWPEPRWCQRIRFDPSSCGSSDTFSGYRCKACTAVLTVLPSSGLARKHFSGAAMALALALWGLSGWSAAQVRALVGGRMQAGGQSRGWRTLARWARQVADGALWASLDSRAKGEPRQVAARAAQALCGLAPPWARAAGLPHQAFAGASHVR
jgi:hypothetical protein